MQNTPLTRLAQQITGCEACKRLRSYCKTVAIEKRRAYVSETYWGKPITGYGDPKARLVIVGLAPAAHGANRTGRIFTGDRSGDWLYRALQKVAMANQPTSRDKADGLTLHDAYVTCVVKCAPPDNKPELNEIERCGRYLKQELEMLTQKRVYLALGQIALRGLWPFVSSPGKARPPFSHGGEVMLEDGKLLVMSYHPSQQNTFTGRLTEPMFDAVFSRCQRFVNTGV